MNLPIIYSETDFEGLREIKQDTEGSSRDPLDSQLTEEEQKEYMENYYLWISESDPGEVHPDYLLL